MSSDISTATRARYTIKSVFAAAAKRNASDIYLAPNNLPILRIKNQFHKIAAGDDPTPMTSEECNALILSSMNEAQQAEFQRKMDFDYALNLEGIGRFRVNVFQASGSYELVARYVAGTPMPLAELGLPDVIEDIARDSKTGLILVTGATGSGKTNTLAGVIDYINRTRQNKIITIEDPIEIVHPNKRSSISQRELYADTMDFKAALRAAMRQRPDVILIGEMRDAETVSTAIGASESGHLVLSTLHSVNAQETIARILDFYPQEEQQQIRNLLATTLRAVVSQKLIVDENGKTRPIVEVLREDGRVAKAIRDPELTHDLEQIMEEGKFRQMQTFDGHLTDMVSEGLLTPERAESYSENPDELHKRMKNSGLLMDQ